MENLQFLIFLAAVIKAVDEYADLLRTSVATPGNDHRLGANEAPPAIISIFVGEELEAVIDAIASDSPYAGPVKMKMDLGVDVLPKFSKDTTDKMCIRARLSKWGARAAAMLPLPSATRWCIPPPGCWTPPTGDGNNIFIVRVQSALRRTLNAFFNQFSPRGVFFHWLVWYTRLSSTNRKMCIRDRGWIALPRSAKI